MKPPPDSPFDLLERREDPSAVGEKDDRAGQKHYIGERQHCGLQRDSLAG